MGGSLACGLFRGAKPSRNPDVETEQFIEYDLRLYLPDNFDPQSAQVKELVSQITNLEWVKDYSTDRWNHGSPSPQSIFYGYTDFSALDFSSESDIPSRFAGTTIELELSVQRKSEWVELSDYWQHLFSPEEISWQAECRQLLRDNGIPYEQGVQQLKRYQNDVARWRLLGAYAVGYIEEPSACKNFAARRHLARTQYPACSPNAN